LFDFENTTGKWGKHKSKRPELLKTEHMKSMLDEINVEGQNLSFPLAWRAIERNFRLSLKSKRSPNHKSLVVP
jgi:hypothetical protein